MASSGLLTVTPTVRIFLSIQTSLFFFYQQRLCYVDSGWHFQDIHTVLAYSKKYNRQLLKLSLFSTLILFLAIEGRRKQVYLLLIGRFDCLVELLWVLAVGATFL